MNEAIVVAAKLLGESDDVQPEPFYISSGITWRDLRAMMIALYDSSPADLDVRYQDDEGDMIILSSEEELKEAFRNCSRTNNVLQINVRALDESPDRMCQESDRMCQESDRMCQESDRMYREPDRMCQESDKMCQEPERAGSYDTPTSTDSLEVNTDSPPESAAELAETGEVPPKHIFDEETGLIHEQNNRELPEAGRPEPPKPETPEYEPPAECPPEVMCHKLVVRKKACYFEIDGSDKATEDRTAQHATQTPAQDKDQESGELSSRKSDEVEAMPYQAFVHFMEKLKQELRNEIVHDVTKKTVKQVLKGFDIAMPHLGRDSKDIRSSHPLYLHEKIFCDKCEKTIIGPRYKCGNCPDYDLCETCEGQVGVHDVDHVFLKLRRPCVDAGRHAGKKVPLLRRQLYQLYTDRSEEHAKLGSGKILEKLVRRQEKMKKREEKVQEKQKRKEEKLKRKLEKLDTNATRDMPQKREKMETKGFLLPQFKYPYQVLGAEFVRDVTIPDYTRVQPGTRMLKTWKMKNTGSHRWSSSTQLRLMWGTITATKTDVHVPYLSPNEEGDVSVELLAPEEPGRYQSHWKLFDHGVNFGHRVWCSIAVDAREILEPKCVDQFQLVLSTQNQTEANESADGHPQVVVKEEEEAFEECLETEEIFVEAHEKQPAPLVIMATKLIPATLIESNDTEVKGEGQKDEASQVETDNIVQSILPRLAETTNVDGVADLLSFEFLDLGDRKTSKASQTATPNNTPLDVSPPKSPAPEVIIPSTVSNSSSVELVECEANPTLQPHLTEYIQQRMASLELKPDTFDDADIESLSSMSMSDEDSDDYCIVPLPECFNTEMPLTGSVMGLLDDNQNEIGTQDENLAEVKTAAHQPSLDEMLTTSGVVGTPALSPEPAPAVAPPAPALAPVTLVEAATNQLAASQQQDMLAQTEDVLPQSEDDLAGVKTEVEEDVARGQTEVKREATAEAAPEEQSEDTIPIQSTPSEFVNQLFHTAIIAASKAGAKAYTTTKDVFISMQAKQAKPNDGTWTPQNTWTPPANNWTPPKIDWTPPKDTWIPPEDSYTPLQSTWVPPEIPQVLPKPEKDDPMKTLIEMGFGNRGLNQQLLERFHNDLDPVVQELLTRADNDWSERRHGPERQ